MSACLYVYNLYAVWPSRLLDSDSQGAGTAAIGSKHSNTYGVPEYEIPGRGISLSILGTVPPLNLASMILGNKGTDWIRPL